MTTSPTRRHRPPVGGGAVAVEVNECRIFATQRGADWWTAFRHMHERTGRVHVVLASPAGDLCKVACDDRKHAAWLVEHAQAQGVPASAVKIAR